MRAKLSLKAGRIAKVGVAIAAAVVVGCVLLWFRAESPAVLVRSLPPPVEIALANRTLCATGFPVRFCEHQSASARGTAPYVLALTNGASKVEALVAVRKCGAKVIGPLPPNGLLVETSVFALGKLSQDARFAAASEWLPDDKVDARLKPLLASDTATLDVTVVALAAADVEGLVELAVQKGGSRVEGCLNGKSSITLTLPRAFVAELAKRGDVRWIEPFERPKLLNDQAVVPAGMNVQTIWNTHGLTGAGQIVTTSDSGIDTGNLATMHADLRNQLLGFKVAYNSCYKYDANGHGTHTAGSIVGDGTLSDGQIHGVAYGAKLWAWFCDGADGYLYTPEDYGALFRPSGATDACVHSASWGVDNNGAYDSECHNMDAYVWEHPDFLPVVANGNAGLYGAQTVGSPASAKNVLSVGSTQSPRSGTPTVIASTSSRGPCADGRIKPDVCAPGVNIVSTRSFASAQKLPVYEANTNYIYMSGTSMATPLTAGAATLVRQWLVERRGFTNAVPTAALVKAILTGGAKDVSTPNSTFGWGRVDLGESLYPSNRAVRLVDRVPFFDRIDSVACEVTLTNTAPFDVQLVWVDYPALAGAAKTLVNDLDLIVSNKITGVTWYGNGIAGGDRTNNVECVRIAAATPGDYAVIVRGADITYESMQGGAAALYLRGAFVSPSESKPRRPRTIFVSASAGDDATATGETNRPYASIAAALVQAAEGDVVRVSAGVYAGGLVAPVGAVRIVSETGPASTVIDGGGTNRCFNASASRTTILSGFTLTNGWVNATNAYGYGAGAYYGVLTNCTITSCRVGGNRSYGGGAAYATLVDCIVEYCCGDYAGGGLYGCRASYCLLRANETFYSDSYGGGAVASSLTHCTVYGNESGQAAGGVDGDCACTNSIVWGNALFNGETDNWETYTSYGRIYQTAFAFSCTTPTGYADGVGNTNAAPRWVNAEKGDFRLVVKSPCLGTASDGRNMGAWQGEPVSGFVLTATSDGPGEVTPAEIFVAEGESAEFTATTHHPFDGWTTNGVFAADPSTNVFIWTDVRADGAVVASFRPTNFFVDANSGDDAARGWSWAEAKRTIQAAVDVAASGETVSVNPGVYTGEVDATAAKIDIVGVAGPEMTVILGDGTSRCYVGVYNPATTLQGFTLDGGISSANYGGGVFYGTLSNCVIRNCTAGECGGGAYNATLIDCVIANCTAKAPGGGACNSYLENCTVRGNRTSTYYRDYRASAAGGGVDYYCEMLNTILWDNIGPDGLADDFESIWLQTRYGWYAYEPKLDWCCAPSVSAYGSNCLTNDPLFVSSGADDPRLYEISPCIAAGKDGANIGAYRGTGIVKALPAIDVKTASGEEVSNAVASVGYVDPSVAAGIGTNGETYAAFRAWSTNGLKSTAVVFSSRAYDSFRVREIVAAPTLLGAGNETRVELTALEPASDGTCSTTLKLVDGESPIPLCAVKAAFARHTRVGEAPDTLAPVDVSRIASELVDDGRAVRLTITPPSISRYFLWFCIE